MPSSIVLESGTRACKIVDTSVGYSLLLMLGSDGSMCAETSCSICFSTCPALPAC